MRTHNLPYLPRTAAALLCAGSLSIWSLLGSGLAQVAEHLGPALTHYKGREIAQTMSYHGAPWLIRETRDQEESPAKLLSALQIREGQTVADVGCGNGFYTLKLAELVGPRGRVLAVDIQPEMLELLAQRAARAGIPPPQSRFCP